MATTTTREQALSLLSTANNHGDLAVKLSSLRQFKSLLSSSSDLTSSLSSDVFPFLFHLHSSPHSLVRKFLLEVIEEIGLRVLDHSSPLVSVLLTLLKDEDCSVAHQSIITGMKFFCAIVQAIAWQFHRHGKIEGWAEEIWLQMIAFKDAVCSLVIEPVSIKTKLLAFKFLETCVLLFTQGTNNYDRATPGVIERRFSISWLPSGHPVLDPVLLKSEANKLTSCLLDMLHSSRNLPGPVTIAIVNCLTGIARKRPDQYGKILSALLDFHLKLETSREGHLASLQYSVRSALLGFLRCTHPAISESKDRLVKLLRSMNAGDAADQALRQVDKLMRNSERHSHDVRISKDDPPSSHPISSGDDVKKRPMSIDNEDNGAVLGLKRIRYTTNGVLSDIAPLSECRDENPTANEIPSTVPMLDDNLNPVEQMIAVISAFLAEGERGAKSLELLVSQIHRDLLADIVITNMKNLPKDLPQVKPASLPFNPPNSSPENVVQITAPKTTNMLAQSALPTTQGSATTIPVNTSLPDIAVSTNHPADSRRDPRRDPRRMDPRRVVIPAEAPSVPSADETSVNSESESPASVNKSTFLPVAPSVDIMLPQAVQDAKADDKITSLSMVSETEQETPKEEPVEESREKSPSPVIRMSVEQALPANVAVDESSRPTMFSETSVNDTSDASFMHDSDEYSSAVSNNSVLEETCLELPQVPSCVDLSQDQRLSVQKMAVERIVRSYKQLKVKDLCQTRIALIARLISWMDDDDLMAILVQEEMVLDYQDQQGHELVMHILYHLHGLKTTESSDQFARAFDLYEKFLLGVARSVLKALPASDKSFSRLLGEAPVLTDSVIKLLENLCCSDDFFQQGKDIREDRITQGLGVVWSLILGRPHYRQTFLDIALKCAVHTEDDIRARAIRLVANKLYPLEYVSGIIEQYSTDMLLSAVDCTSDTDLSQSVRELTGENASVSGPQQSEPAASVGSVVNVEQGATQSVAGVSFSEAQRLISLYFALCTKKPCLLQLLFDVYARFGKSAKRAIHRHVPILLRALGSSYSELFCIISDPPTGSENLIVLVLQILAEQGTPSPDLISTIKNLYETKFKDAAILIPILSSFSKDEVLPIFPRLVELPLDKFQQALAHVLQGTAHTGPALTPTEVLVAIHDIVPEKEGMALKKVMDACSACFEQRTVFTQHVLAKALNQMVDRTPLPLLFMRTVIQAIDAFPTLVDFVMEMLSKLVNRQIWKLPKLWVGFLKCVSQTQPHSFRVLLQLPEPQLESALNKYANLRGPLSAYASQPSVRSSLPRSTLSVLGLTNEPQLAQHMGSQMRTSEASSIHGATPT